MIRQNQLKNMIRQNLADEGDPTCMASPDENLKCNKNTASEALNAVIGIPEGMDYLSLKEVPAGVDLFDTFSKYDWFTQGNVDQKGNYTKPVPFFAPLPIA